jgi:serine protease AprX
VNSSDTDPWPNRVLCALGVLALADIDADEQKLREAVAAQFASRFAENDRLYANDRPQWHNDVDEAVNGLIKRRLVARRPPKNGPLRLTAAGQREADGACKQALGVDERPLPPASTEQAPTRDPLLAGIITPPLRERFVVDPGSDQSTSRSKPLPIMIELNLRFESGFDGAMDRVQYLWHLVGGQGIPFPLANQYAVGELTSTQIEGLVSADVAAVDGPKRAIFRVWPDFDTHPQIDQSSTTIKAIPAQRAFGSFGDGIVWAVVDSGVWAKHPHFQTYGTLTDSSVMDLHRDFTDDNDPKPLEDADGHGTHVAGIIAGGLVDWNPPKKVIAAEKRFNVAAPNVDPILQPRDVKNTNRLAGMAPRTKLVSLKVLGGGDLAARVSRVMRALAHVRKVNESSPRIHGVNLSLGYEYAAEWYACGYSPLCVEVDKLVRSGVVVVVAAGNSGYVTLNPKMTQDITKFTADMTINDPGNTERAITVGSTHRHSPHTYGVSYFSSRGPTGDGRRKPDLVAPGETITSAAAGKDLIAVQNQAKVQIDDDTAAYIEKSGTSMAAPHVSGAVAAFLSVQREHIGRPDDIKRIFVDSATSLGRDTAFQGSGLVDLLRALQSV